MLVPVDIRYLMPSVMTANFNTAAKAMATYLLNLAVYPATRARVTLPNMMTGTAAASLFMPIKRATQGVMIPTHAPARGPTYKLATNRTALMPGPVTGWGRVIACRATAKAARIPVLTTS